MLSSGTLVLALATLSLAATPQGFQPSSQTDLLVTYGNVAALNGAVIPRDATQVLPTLATAEQLTGQYAVIMIDIDVPGAQIPQTRTLLHWFQTGLTSAATATAVNTTSGPRQAFVLQNRANATALIPYFGPNPPARIPLSHRYTFILVNHTQITQQGLAALRNATTAENNRVFDFNAPAVLQAAGLTNGVVAGNFFNVTNPGPLNDTRVGATPSGTAGPGSSAVPAAGALVSPSLGACGLLVGLLSALFLGL